MEENDEVVPDERSLPVVSPHLPLFETVLSLHNFRHGIEEYIILFYNPVEKMCKFILYLTQ